MKNWPEVQKARPVIRMPEMSPSPPERVDRPLEERPDHPPDADEQEQEPEHVGQPGEGVDGIDEADDRGDQEQAAEQRRHPAVLDGEARGGEVLRTPASRNMQPDEDARRW